VDAINGSLAMAMGSFKLGDIKRGTVLEPTFIVMQIPLAIRSQVSRLGDLPIPTQDGRTIPLSELGQFKKGYEEPVQYTIDLRGVEYVTGEMQGRLGAPIYGMLNIDDKIKEYLTPDGVKMETMPWTLLELNKDDSSSHYEWTGEWTVTYETFRDMGGAFMAAMILIYGLIVWEFKNFALAGIIMSPIPVTMMGIVPGHWIFGAEFTATSMIGMIALGGIIVRQSILIVEFVKIEVAKGNEVAEAAVKGAEMRMRPIFITSLTLMAGAFAILDDPIFNGMAISLLFGAGVATVMALLIIPLGCISAKKQFYVETADDGTVSVSPAFQRIEQVEPEAAGGSSGTPLLMRLWGGIFSLFSWLFIFIKAVFTLIGMGFKGITGKFGGGGGGAPPPPRETPPGGGTPPPPRETPPGGGTPPPSRETPPGGGTPPPPRETPPGGGTPPPPREKPPAGGTPPPPREKPTAGGTPPPPRETPPAGGTPPPRETPPQAQQAAVGKDSTVAEGESESDSESDGTVGKKRRGIRLKQDLN
ncbi:MAG: efflux RND transporter permease subunit, partial [Gammaproteobacteria bacterium]|nr:efflux RND transporter permease subunit [Gammaproteobacteria bacterium]